MSPDYRRCPSLFSLTAAPWPVANKVSLITFNSVSEPESVSEETSGSAAITAFDLSRVILENWNKPFKSLLLRDIFAIFSDFPGRRLVLRRGVVLVELTRGSGEELWRDCGAPMF